MSCDTNNFTVGEIPSGSLYRVRREDVTQSLESEHDMLFTRVVANEGSISTGITITYIEYKDTDEKQLSESNNLTTDEIESEVAIKEVSFRFYLGTVKQELTDVFLNELKKLGLDMQNCRGQGFVKGANLKGRHSGVQTRISSLNPLAFFVSCACHNLNLFLSDAAKSSFSLVFFFSLKILSKRRFNSKVTFKHSVGSTHKQC
ncbi:uncharacterized protein LOC124809579 [Hydra vulgaris]|uniref:uncharacterized protein LOC124809579 n=1 Tax=Hydra vulgaris TaxID=6087 RepID=UPI001F5F3440|nr:uncharacterized protein LOC124809579 [Hydra vulgaris]